MKSYLLIFTAVGVLVSGQSWGAACSKANLTRCLDSACAINIGANPAARCQYCGTASAGAPKAGGMRSVSVGASAKYNISDKELKKAPSDPAERYAWAAKICLQKVAGCTTDDVADNYDSLIEQSCKAAGVSSQMASLSEKAAKARTKTSCASELKSCIIKDNRCGADYSACATDADFNKQFAACGVDATGCDSFMSEIRGDIIAARDSMIEGAEQAIENIVLAYQQARESRLASAEKMCKDNAGRDSCVESACAKNMPNKCAPGFEAERALATQMCKFYEIACDTLKR